MNDQTTDSRAPKAPTRLADLGINITLLREILLKTMLRRNLDNVLVIAESLKVSVPVAQELLEITREYKQIETLGTSRHDEPKNLRYMLTESGRQTALDALSQSEYFGAIPVPLEAYKAQTQRQSVRDATVSRADLAAAMSHLVINDEMFRQLGPAVNSPRSVLMFGPPGNGKSSIADGIRNAYTDHIFVPEFVEYAGNVISLFDPLIHERVKVEVHDPHALRLASNNHDPRYIKCHRPTVITGGELTLDMLDLTFNPVSKTYQAPLQMKSSGGVFIVDDLGRQKDPPQTLINRWIVPMEEGFDILTLQSGQKFIVPFDTKVMFSTNFSPSDIFDPAAMRRIFYKIPIENPNQQDFIKIFLKTIERYPMVLDEDVLTHLLQNKYPGVNNQFAAFHAGFLMDHMMASCRFENIEPHMSIELVDDAWRHLFVPNA